MENLQINDNNGTRIAAFTCSPFAENTYVVYDASGECVIVDPGCITPADRKELTDFISAHKLRPVYLLNTHCHIDHILGNRFVAEKYKIPLCIHRGELALLEAAPAYAENLGLPYEKSPEPAQFLAEGDILHFGHTALRVLFAPGHTEASICFYDAKNAYILSGDVLFYDSIGRTDLPGGDYNTLIASIRDVLLTLPDNVRVLAGHMQETTIGRERHYNPFLQELSVK